MCMSRLQSKSMATSAICAVFRGCIGLACGLPLLAWGATTLEEDVELSRAAIKESKWAEAIPPTLRAAEAGHISSQHNLANMYAQGLGMPRSWPDARRWWRQAADAGHVAANLNAALALLTGDGGPVDAEAGMRYLKCAALLGNDVAQYELAERLAALDESEVSPERVAWYWIAAKSGNPKANNTLIKIGNRFPEKQAAKMLDHASMFFLSTECPRAADGMCRDTSTEGRIHNANALDRRLLVHRMMSGALSLQAFVGHAGDGGRRDTRGIVDVLEMHRSALSSQDKPMMRLAVADRLKVSSAEAVRLPKEQFWGYLRPGDSVLLSDRVTHHYSIVFGVDRAADQIFFLDAWPDKFFALEDPELRQQGVALTSIGCGKRLVKMPRKTFEELALAFSGIRDHAWPPTPAGTGK